MSTIVSDQIMAIGGHRKARVLVRDDQRMAVFVSPTDGPVETYVLAERTRTHFVTADGTQIRFRPVGSSCSWPLARCRITTEKLAATWT